MKPNTDIECRLEFLRAAESLKDTLRSAHTTTGRVESVAEHTWRLCLFAVTFADLMPEVDLLRLLRICIFHDLGEAVNGDIPAPQQDATQPKSNSERADFASLIATLPARLQESFLQDWDDYDGARSHEARTARALDKLETILQHNQGRNPEDFDFAFNLDYGKDKTDAIPLARRIREQLDRDTARRARASRRPDSSQGDSFPSDSSQSDSSSS